MRLFEDFRRQVVNARNYMFAYNGFRCVLMNFKSTYCTIYRHRTDYFPTSASRDNGLTHITQRKGCHMNDSSLTKGLSRCVTLALDHRQIIFLRQIASPINYGKTGLEGTSCRPILLRSLYSLVFFVFRSVSRAVM